MVDGPERARRVRSVVDLEPLVPEGRAGRAGELGRLCAALVRVTPAGGAGMTVLVDGAPPMVVAFAGRHAEQLEELQLTVGEGPCVDAARLRRPVFEADLVGAGARRWPAYGPAAQALDVEAVFAFPLQVGAACAGVLDVYRAEPGSLPREAVLDAFAFADLALAILLEDQQDAVDRSPDHDVDGLPTPAILYQAQGMVMIQLGGTLAEAMVRIRAHAYAQDRRLNDIADDITSGKLALTRDDG